MSELKIKDTIIYHLNLADDAFNRSSVLDKNFMKPKVNLLISELIKNDQGISFHEIDAVEKIDLARRLHVKSSPTVLFFNEDGLEEGRIIGAPKSNEIRNTLEKITTIKMEKTNAN